MVQSDILVLIVKDKDAAQYLTRINGFKRVIVVCLKREDTDAVFEIVKKLTGAHVSRVSFFNVTATASDVYAKLGRNEPNPVLFFRSASGNKREVKVAKALKEELSKIVRAVAQTV